MKCIEIIVSPAGETRLETKGYKGSECLQASQFLEGALGKKVGEHLTAEFYQQSKQQQAIQENA